MSLVFKPNESTTCQWALKISNELLSKMSLVAYWLKKKKKKPANAGDTGSIPGLGGSHMSWSN